MKKLLLALILVCAAAPSAVSATTIGRPINLMGLIASWSFDSSTVSGSSVTDTSGNSKTMTLSGSTATSGKYGQARSYNGSSDYAVANLGTQPSSISISLWLYANSTADQSIVDFQDGGTPMSSYHMTVLGIKGGALYASYWNISNLTGPTLSTGQWYHAVLTYDNSTHAQNLYLNGVLQGSNTGTWSGPGTLYMYLAQRQQSCSFNDSCGTDATFFNGSIDEVRVFSRALSADDVRALYGGGARVGTANTTTLTNGLAGYWPLDGKTLNWATGKAQDLSGNGNTGQMVSMSTSTAPVAGKVGQALASDSSGSVQIPVVTTAVENVSLAAWVYWNGTTAAAQIPLYNGNSGANGYGFLIGNGGSGAGNKIQILTGGKVYNALTSAPVLPTGVWTHLAIVNDAGTWTLYVNGVAQATGALGGTPGVPSNGAGVSSFGGFKGAIDEVRIYSRALSASEIRELYQLGKVSIAQSNTIALNSGLAGYWSLDGNTINWSTNKALDVSGHSAAATLISLGTTTAPVAGKVGQALQFAGAGKYISASASPSTSAYSVSAWIRYQGPTPISNIKVALSYGSGSASRTLWIGYASDGKLAISNSSVDIKSSTVSNSTAWQHMVAVVSGGTLYAYMNGSLAGSTSMSSRDGDTLLLGEYIGYIGTFSFPGTVDDVRVYSRALSAAEVGELYRQSK